MKAKEMAGNTNCAQIRERMLDAVTDSLSGGDRAAFDAHLGGCAACAKEFRRVQVLTQAINLNLSAQLAGEPCPQLIANVRRQMIAEPHRATWWWQRSAWLTTAGVCAVLAMFIVAARSLHKFNRPTQSHTVALIQSPSPAKSAVPSRLNAAIGPSATSPPRKPAPALAIARHASVRAPRRNSAEPEVIIQPGQMQAVLQLVSAAQKREIDGAALFDSEKKPDEPLEIKPLTIAPLKISALKDDSESLTSSSSQDGSQELVSGESN